MPISARELFLIIRAKDEASRVLRGLGHEFSRLSAQQQVAAHRTMAAGSALASIGAGMGLIGAAGLKFMMDATKASVDYTKQTALTRTQVDGLQVSTRQLEDMGLRVAKSIGAPLEELQPALYDIFSSIDVNIPQSERLLRAFAKTAVAGNVDVQTAGRATIAIMNAFNVPIRDVSKVMDFQFQLVRKGVGTYEDFARTIGRSIPSAARAGQTYETLGGMLAYLTRNGLSAAMASASAGRAFDAMSHPKTVKKLEKMGITMRNNNGEFRPMIKIVADIQKELDGLSKPERAKALYNIFKGSGGTIQARRFFDLVMNGKREVKEFTGFVRDMEHATGNFAKGMDDLNPKVKAMQRELKTAGPAAEAYSQVSDTTAVRLQLLKNRWEAARIELGREFIPVLERVMTKLEQAMRWWDSLDAATKKNIATWSGIAAVAITVIGVLTALAGVVIMFKGALMLMNITALGAATRFGLIAAAAYILVQVFQESEQAGIMLATALGTLFVISKLRGLFSGFGSAVGTARASVQLYGEAVRTGSSHTAAFRDVVGAGMGPAITKFKGALSRGMAMLGGPWGIAITAGITLLAGYMNKQRESAARVQEHTDALNTQTGALTRNNRQIAVKALQDSGAFDAARKMGIGLKDVTDAALGNSDAIRRVTKQTRDWVEEQGGSHKALGKGGAAMTEAGEAARKLTGAIGTSNSEISKARQKWVEFTEAMGSAGKKAETTGTAIGQGLARGIANSRGIAVAEAQATINRINRIMRDTARIESPSKMTEEIGDLLGKGLVKGLAGTSDELEATASKLIDKIKQAFEDAEVKVDKSLINMVTSARKKLRPLAEELDTTFEHFKSIYEATVQLGALSGLGERTDAEGNTLAPTGSTIMEDLAARVAAAKSFAANLMKLTQMGLNKQALAELAASGVEQGSAAAAALVTAGQDTINQINALEKQLLPSAKKIAKIGSAAMYDAGEMMAKGIKEGFRSQEKELLDEMERIARKMIRRIKHELGIKSPARALMPVGMESINGMIVGLHQNAPRLYREMTSVADGMSKVSMAGPGFNRPVVSGATGTGGVHQEFTIITQEIDPVKHAADLGWEVARRV